MILAGLLFVLFACLTAVGAAWIAYEAKGRIGPALLAAGAVLLAFVILAAGVGWVVIASMRVE